MGCFCQNHTIFQLETFMTLKGDVKFKGKLTHGMKNDIRNLFNFHASSWKSENWYFDGPLLPKAWFRWKSIEELCLMTLKSDTKSEEKLTLGFKNDMMNLVNFNPSSGKSKNVHIDEVLLLSIAFKVSAKKVQKNYLSWHWKKIQTLKKNWLF